MSEHFVSAVACALCAVSAVQACQEKTEPSSAASRGRRHGRLAAVGGAPYVSNETVPVILDTPHDPVDVEQRGKPAPAEAHLERGVGSKNPSGPAGGPGDSPCMCRSGRSGPRTRALYLRSGSRFVERRRSIKPRHGLTPLPRPCRCPSRSSRGCRWQDALEVGSSHPPTAR